MRIAGIKNNIIGQNIAVNKNTLKNFSYDGGFCGAEIIKDADYKIINFDDARSKYIKYRISLTKPEKIKNKTQYTIPEQYLPVVEKSKEIPVMVPYILKQADEIYKYARDARLKARIDYLAASPDAVKMRLLERTCDSDSFDIQTTFDRNGKIKIIRDYKNNRAILFEDMIKNKDLKYTVLLNCSDVSNPEKIEAEESFTFESGKLIRYTTSCKADINSDNFIASEAFGFKDNVFKTYDEILSVSYGTEYSSKYYEFETLPGFLFAFEPDRCNFKRFVGNKVAVEGRVYYSSDEFLMSQCEHV